ncbi:MAG: hypothetical protein AB8G22_10805 [Saprospiraceae bacterium]
MLKNTALLLICMGLVSSIYTVVAQSPRVVLASYGINENVEPEIPKRLVRKFRRDAARLVLRMESQKEDLRYLNIDIPKKSIDNVYKILTGIYLYDKTAKSIADCNVHTFPDPSIDHFVLIFDRDTEWAEPLRSGITETDSEEINDLLNNYDLVIEKHVKWNDTQDAITIRSSEPLNMAALANEFYNVEGVSEIDFGLPKVTGNDIQLRPVLEGWEVHYILKFGSYINGNGKKHTWVYRFDTAGKIQLVSETGDEIPEWMRCEIQNAIKHM